MVRNIDNDGNSDDNDLLIDWIGITNCRWRNVCVFCVDFCVIDNFQPQPPILIVDSF